MRTLLMAGLALAACRSSSSPAQPQPPSSGGAAQAELAAYVPADTAVAFFVERALLDHPFTDSVDFAEPRRDLAEAAARPRTTPADRFWGVIAEELAPLDDAALRKAGWRPGQSELVIYTVGLVPIVRARVDGAAFRALLDRASAASGLKPAVGDWKGTPYLVFTPEPGEAQILIASNADQVVMAVAMKHEAVLDHVTSFVPPSGDTLASTWSIGDAADRLAYLEPARMGALIADPQQLKILIGDSEDTPNAGCLTAVGRFIATLPRLTSTVTTDQRSFSMQFALDVSAEVAAMLRGGPVPGWPDDKRRNVPTFRMAVGAPPYPLAVRALNMMDGVLAAGAACGKDAESPGIARMIAELAPLQIVQGATWEMAAFDGVEITMTLALAVRDVPALWTMLATALPMLGRTVPAIGEVRDIPGPAPIKIGIGRDRMVGSIGAAADSRVRDYLDAAPGPRAPIISRIDHDMMRGFREGTFRFFGETMKADDPDEKAIIGDATLDSRVEGNRLLIDMTLHKVR